MNVTRALLQLLMVRAQVEDAYSSLHALALYFDDCETGSSICSKCGSGTYAPSNGSDACMKCRPGTYANSTGSSGCLECGAGAFSQLEGVYSRVVWMRIGHG